MNGVRVVMLIPAGALALAALACAGKAGARTSAPATVQDAAASAAEKNLFAVFETDKGRFEARLFQKEAPKTVARFKESAEGGRYDGAAFLRVIPDFLVQAGAVDAATDPASGLPIESAAGAGFERPGLLAMAAAGAQAHSSQFFVTLAAAPWLSGKNTVFGEVVSGLDAVREIASLPRVERDPATGALIDRPVDAVVIKTVRIESK